jgi:hypothetical protein
MTRPILSLRAPAPAPSNADAGGEPQKVDSGASGHRRVTFTKLIGKNPRNYT